MVGTKAKGQRNELAIRRPLLLTEMANSEKKKGVLISSSVSQDSFANRQPSFFGILSNTIVNKFLN